MLERIAGNADVPAFNQLTHACDGVQDLHRVGGLPLNRQHLGALGAIFKNAGQLGFAALSNDVPAEAVVVLDLLSEGLFPSLGRHDSWFCSRAVLEQFLEQNSPSGLQPAVARQQKSGLATA